MINSEELQRIKQRFSIIGTSPELNRAIEIAYQVAGTDLSVLITGESGAGKENFPQIIHQFSARKHGTYIAVNCGAIPEGTIDSELFGHEKGSFTGAHEKRKGYFEVADGGTIFLDEIAELPIATQSKLLRILESGEFIKVGASTVQKTNVRIVAATNVNLPEAVQKRKFREDLYYRLNTVPIYVSSLRQRKEDIFLLFRKFTRDFSEKYKIPPVSLTDDARAVLESYRWPGNIRQLKNITEQISIIETDRIISGEKLKQYLPDFGTTNLPMVYNSSVDETTFHSEREILYKILFDMKSDMNDLKKLVFDLMKKNPTGYNFAEETSQFVNKVFTSPSSYDHVIHKESFGTNEPEQIQDTVELLEETLSLEAKEIEMIRRALEKFNGKRKYAAQELGISERTLYRKIKEYDIEK
ncbi:MAG TPA: sigma-54-dependent Fis family transcriptional regulator [Bacteroidales bacterium]|nr:sigma-54-dependent Fis family transcriptional regulator [Bacteroidales bacterium]